MKRQRGHALFGVAGAFAGCFADWTVPEEAAPCDPSACKPAPPADWNGPVSLHIGTTDAEPACELGSTLVYSGKIDVAAPPATCSCSCELTKSLCDEALVDLLVDKSPACSTANPCQHLGIHVPAQACTPVEGGSCGTYWAIKSASAEAKASCEPAPKKEVTPAAFEHGVVACSSAGRSGCASGQGCVTPGGAACLYAEGELACPAGPYMSKTVVFQSIEDDRSCSTCSCNAEPGTCDGIVSVSTEGDCSNQVGELGIPVLNCLDVEPTIRTIGLGFEATPKGASCQASGGEAIGTTKPLEPTTFCCLP